MGNPCRVGLVFYQHASLHLPQHGKAKTERKNLEREFRDYLCWLAGDYVPTPSKLTIMKNMGFVFPIDTPTVPKDRESKPEEKFNPSKYPGFEAGKWIDDVFYRIDVLEVSNYAQ